MRNCLFSLLIVLLLLLGQVGFPAQAGARSFRELQFPPLPEIRLPEYQRFQLKNGLVVYLVEDHQLPLVSGTALIETGSRFEPADQVGVASMTGAVLRSGGTLSRKPQEINGFLEQRAASIETNIGVTAGSASFSALSDDLGPVFSLFAEMLRQPAFDPVQVELVKSRVRGSLDRRNDDPEEIAEREFEQLIYGARSPYGRTMDYGSLERIQREDLLAFYQQFFFPNRMILGIVGDFESAQMRSRIEQAFGDWQPTRSRRSPLPVVRQANKDSVFLVDQPQLNQSSVRLGHLGGVLKSKDYAALSVLNDVLNGFGGRVTREVRSRQGLAYSVYAFWSPNFDYPGLFVAGAQTRSETTAQLIQSLRAEIDKVRREPILTAELNYAKESAVNSFVFNFQTPVQTLSRLMRYEYYGYPQDFIFRYRKAVEATTIAEVQRVARQYLKPEQLVTLVVGNAAIVEEPLVKMNNGKSLQRLNIELKRSANQSATTTR